MRDKQEQRHLANAMLIIFT